MKCLVTGSEGFIGKNLVAALKADGHEVDEWDVKNGDDITRNFFITHPEDTFDVVYHLACMNQMTAADPDAAIQNLEVNAYGTRRLAEYAVDNDAKFVYTSTASVYGNAEQIPTPVTAKLNPLTDYAVAKLAGEYFVQNSGADWTILRLSNVYGPHQTLDNPYCGVIGRFLEQEANGEPLTVIGDGMQTRDFTYVGDVVEHLQRAAYKCAYPSDYSGRIFNVSRGRETPVEYVARSISHNIKRIEKRPIDGVDRRCLVPDLLCPTTLDAGIRLTKDWFREHRGYKL